MIRFHEIRQIAGYPRYGVSDDGRCWSRWSKLGYLKLKLCDGNGGSVQRWVHRLVLEAFVSPCPDGSDACHANGVRDDNRLANLRWDSRKANLKDRESHGTVNRGSRNGQAVLTEDKVRDIRRRLAVGERVTSLARVFGVSPSSVSGIKTGKRWGGLT